MEMESHNPYEDFQQSMLNMIIHDHLFSAPQLFQLLNCFLSLNSPAHHHLILSAFFHLSIHLSLPRHSFSK
ncbi:Transcription repressor OFP6 [Bienertia sinuspersici]